MKTLIVSFMLIFCQILQAQFDDNIELAIKNFSTNNNTIRVRIFPVSIVFNGYNDYNLNAKYPVPSGQGQPEYHYINSRNVNVSQWDLSPNQQVGFNHDKDHVRTGVVGCVGFGVYKVEVRWGTNFTNLDTCTIEWDAGYPGNFSGDLGIRFRDDNNGIGGSGPRLTYIWNDSCGELNISYVNNRITAWYHCEEVSRSKYLGNMIYSTANGNNRALLPQDFRQDCGSENYPYQTISKSIGLLTLNLTIDKNIRTRLFQYELERYAAPEQIIISSLCTLKINGGKTFTVKFDPAFYVPDPELHFENYYNKFYVMPNAHLILNPTNAQLIFENTNWFIMEQGSHINIGAGSYIRMQRGSKYCNKGGTINRSGYFYIDKGVEYCYQPDPTICYFQDSVKVIIEDTASFEIPDSTVYVFEGSQTAFICKNQSKIKFGKGSKLIFNDGARIFADHTTFTTIDSNTTWDGIYLNDLAYDTLKNCTIENALNGINIADNVSLYDVPAVEISNCTFSNKTGSQLLNQVYVNNSANVIIRNCTSSSLISEGFAAGIIMEYCSAGGMNVIDNNINYVSSGINVIQSSPYIARNTITGPEASGTGIYLDNSNGTIEYNTVNNFENSVSFYYSSPYVLKNHFNDASLSAVDITAVSVPVMKPIISGTELSWLGGNNYFSGSPETAGITFNSDAYPLMDSGYNVISVGNSLYMQGTITTELKARINNWYDDPPDDEKFDISAGVDYSEYFDGQTIPGTDYYDLNSIGFGLYDTVFVDDLEQNTISPEEMFILAYRKEMERHFTDAIDAYKNVISIYKTSNYAVSSLARIFNCLEKMIAGTNDYNSIKTYYTGLKNSNNYPVQVREISEDLAIKSKVRMGQIEDAISDYQTIINNFPNTPKSIHAQINKMCLENMLGEGDMMMNGQGSGTNYKSRLLTLITGKEPVINKPYSSNLPKHFRLYQNYPNPFNPMTSIKYEIPQDANIKLTVYDITGREIISINEYRQAGVYTYTFDGTNLASGVYIYKVESDKYTETKKMILVK